MASISNKIMLPLRALALKQAAVSEGVACAGTAVESRTIKVGKSAFLFLCRRLRDTVVTPLVGHGLERRGG